MNRTHRPGTILQVTLAAAALGAAATGVYYAAHAALERAPVPALAQSLEPLSTAELARALHRLGLDPATLACAGLNATQTRAAVDAVQSHLQEHVQTLRDADDRYATARSSVDALERLVRSGQASPQDLSALTAARSSLAAAESNRAEALDAAFSAAVATMAAGPRAAVQARRANQAWDLPTPYTLGSRTQVQFVALRDALANERIAQNLGEQAEPACAALLATVRAEAATAAALVHLGEPNLSTITSAWNQAVND